MSPDMSEVRRLARLARMDGQEVKARLAAACRREASRLACGIRRPSWRRESLANALRADGPSGVITAAIEALNRGEWHQAHANLLEHFASRTPRFVLNPADHDRLAQELRSSFPGSLADA